MDNGMGNMTIKSLKLNMTILFLRSLILILLIKYKMYKLSKIFRDHIQQITKGQNNIFVILLKLKLYLKSEIIVLKLRKMDLERRADTHPKKGRIKPTKKEKGKSD